MGNQILPLNHCHRSLSRRSWWKESAVYQIYPASFKDSNGDGVGDLIGIISELDYIKDLGVNIVWLSPVLKSPQIDMGYDISDYRDIHHVYGTMADHDALIQGLHDRGLKYVMDLVVNHTSDQHEWFKSSRSSKASRYRDWYIWRPARYNSEGVRSPPNNWESGFSGSAWEWDDATEEYYLHLYAREQPDLNWENPEVVSAVHDIIRFWLDRGVDGFRMDVINQISKEPGLPDGPVLKPGFLQSGQCYYSCGPRLHEFLSDIGAILREYDAFSVGEMPGVFDTNEILKAVSQDRGELSMAFHFESVSLDSGPDSKWSPNEFRVGALQKVANKWQKFMIKNNGWNALYMENHDQGRSISRFASDVPEYRALCGKMLATHLALQSGTVFVYQGQELAQINVPRSWTMDKYRDIECLNHWKQLLRDHPNDLELQERTRAQYRLKSRDNARTPMQWSAAANAGFSTAEPWMDVHLDYKEWNAANQRDDPSSTYSYWRQLLDLRRAEKEAFIYGDFELVDVANENVIAYLRTPISGGRTALIVTSFSANEALCKIPKMELHLSNVLISNYEGPIQIKNGIVTMKPFEAFVLSD